MTIETAKQLGFTIQKEDNYGILWWVIKSPNSEVIDYFCADQICDQFTEEELWNEYSPEIFDKVLKLINQ